MIFEVLQLDQRSCFAGVTVDLSDDDFWITGKLRHAALCPQGVCSFRCPVRVHITRLQHLSQFAPRVLGAFGRRTVDRTPKNHRARRVE